MANFFDLRETDYKLYRGKCREMAEALVKQNPEFRLVRGFYHCPLWGKQSHWWTVKPDGMIVDPSVAQFPSYGAGEYEEFNGIVRCEECGKELPEESAYIDNNHTFCDGKCYGRYVGLGEYIK
jgi:hypothetical protein